MTTNYDRIKSMSLDELAEFLKNCSYCSSINCDECYLVKNNMESLCSLYERDFKQWLNQEVEE